MVTVRLLVQCTNPKHLLSHLEIELQKAELSDTSQNTPVTLGYCSTFGPVRQFKAPFVTSYMICNVIEI